MILWESRLLGFSHKCVKLSIVLPHRVVEPLTPVAGLALGVGDGIDDDAIVEFMPTLVPVAFSRQIVI